jgi:hypothetical protein
MNLERFAELVDLEEAAETEKIKLLTYYLTRSSKVRECELSAAIEAIDTLHFPAPNSSRLRKNISKSSDFVKASSVGRVKLHAASIKKLKNQFPELNNQSEEIISQEEILPKIIYSNCPNYIKRLADQINSAYDNNIFDGCSVLMRRLLEVSLILAYKKLGIESEIQAADGTFKLLDGIIQNSKTSSPLSLSRNAKKNLDDFKKLGNFAAHRIEYSTRRADIDNLQIEFRATIEELIIKAGMDN